MVAAAIAHEPNPTLRARVPYRVLAVRMAVR
jgi:hypothetical protein